MSVYGISVLVNIGGDFVVKGIVPYSVGLSAFMDIDSMRELFDEDDDYYTARVRI